MSEKPLDPSDIVASSEYMVQQGVVPVAARNDAEGRAERRRIVKFLVIDGIFAGTMMNIVTGVLLIKFALELGATAATIGLLAAIPFLAQFMQVPSVVLLSYFPYRKMMVLIGAVVYRLSLGWMVYIPFISDKEVAISALIAAVLMRELGLGWGAGPWYSWVSVLVPERIMGRAYGARLRTYTMAGTVAALLAGFLLDSQGVAGTDKVLPVFSLFFLTALMAGMVSLFVLVKLPERILEKQSAMSMLKQIRDPFFDLNFRRLLAVMLVLLFSVNIVVPFFPYYMFTSLEISTSYVIALWALNQMMQVPFFKWWGWVGDRFSHVTALRASLPFFIISLLLWPFVALPDVHQLTGLLLIVIHVLMGIGLAGVTLATQIIAMKMAPKSKVTGYTASLSLVAAFASGMGALLGGILADKVAPFSLRVKLEWHEVITSVDNVVEATPYVVTGFEFLFLFAAILILLIIPLLKLVAVKGSVPQDMVMKIMRNRAKSILRGSLSGPGVRGLVYFPVSLLLKKKKVKLPDTE